MKRQGLRGLLAFYGKRGATLVHSHGVCPARAATTCRRATTRDARAACSFGLSPLARSQNFSTKKRPRANAWRELQKEMDERERLEEENETKFARMEAMRARTALEDELDPERLYAYIDVVIGRDMGKDPQLTRGRLIFELFDDIMPRTIDQFVRMLETKNEREPSYVGSTISRILPGNMCVAGDRTSNIEGASSGRELVFSRVDQEANWQVRAARACVIRDATAPRVTTSHLLFTVFGRCLTSTRACSL